MTDLSRRGFMSAVAAVTALTAASPALARQAVAAATGATWDLRDLYADAAAWTAERNAVLAALPGLTAYKGRLGESAATLRAFLEASSAVDKRVGRLFVYATLKNDEDVRIPEGQERRQLATDLASVAEEAVAWFSPELLVVGKPKIDTFLAAEPALAKFRFSLDNVLRQAPHTLSAEGEGLLAAAGPVIQGPRQIRSVLNASDIPWPEVTLSTGEKVRLDNQGYNKVRGMPNRADRKLAMDQTFGTYGKFQASLGATLASKIKGDVFQAKARKYDNSLQFALSGPNIPEGVYRTLVAEANKGLPQLHRYFELRRKLLQLPDLYYYDIYPPVVALDRKFTLEEMRSTTLAALKPLGDDYVRELSRITQLAWSDPRPRPGKTAGAYVFGSAYDVHPYVLLNLEDKYDDMSTYAHEWGHAMHTQLSRANQPYETFGYSTFTAEIASTCNEQLLINHMLRGAKTKEEKLFYLGQRAEGFRGAFYRQTMFAEFELAAHEADERGEGVSGDSLTKLYLELLKKYHGPGMTIDPAYGSEWGLILHFLNYNFYVFQYATSMAGSIYFAEQLATGRAAERDRYLGVLKAGGSDFAYNILKNAGLDLATPAPYQALIASFKTTLDEMEKLVG